jgi:hypothetical protein
MKSSTLAYLSKHMKSSDLHAIADKHAASGNQTSERSVRRMAEAMAKRNVPTKLTPTYRKTCHPRPSLRLNPASAVGGPRRSSCLG